MASVFDVAKFILEEEGEISIWKLQELCYYCKVWDIALEGRKLFPEYFEAWQDGPVCPELFRAYKSNSFIDSSLLKEGDSTAISNKDADVIRAVLKHYENFDEETLQLKACYERPWLETIGSLSENARCGVMLDENTIDRFYSASEEAPIVMQLINKYRAERRSGNYKCEYSFEEFAKLTGITVEDIQKAEKIEVELD